MKNYLLAFFLFAACIASAQEPLTDNVLFSNSRMTGSYFFSKTTSKAPSSISNKENKLPVKEDIFFTPGNALQLKYVNGANGNWSAIIYRQELRGQDHFKKATYLSFHIYHAPGDIGLPAIQLLKGKNELSRTQTFQVKQTGAWERVMIPVDSFALPFEDAGDITGIVFSQHGYDQSKHTLYIDDVELVGIPSATVPAAKPSTLSAKGYAKHVDLQWQPITENAVKYVKIYRANGNEDYQPVGIQSPSVYRYTDFTGETGKTYHYKIAFLNDQYKETNVSDPATAQTREMSDDDMLSMVQEACFRYYWEGAESHSGLAKENMPGRQNMIAMGASGFGMMALIVGTERNFITRQQSVERFIRVVDFLDRAETFHGAFPHFADGPSGKVEPFFGRRDNGGDLVETSFLIQGLLAAKAYFNKNDTAENYIRNKITKIWERVEWDWYKQFPDSKFLYWHWSPDQAWVINHNLIGWNETMVTYLLAIASPTHAIPASMYYTGWANQDQKGQQYRSNWGGTKDGSHYTNGNTYYGVKLDIGVSNGGPLFFTHYSYLGYDPHFISDKYTNYFDNNKKIALINLRYCMQNPNHYKDYGDSCWGLTASDGPFNYSADEPIAKRDIGKIAPTGAISSFPYTPEASMKALKNYYNNYGRFLWGEYGFRDAFDLNKNWCSDIYMGLNQAPMVVMIENHRTGLIWKLFMSNKDIQEGLKKLGAETNKNN